MIRFRNFCIVFTAVPFLASCMNDLQVSAPELDVKTVSIEVKAGEPVVFEMDGNADYVTFWSGETYSDYSHRNGRKFTPGILNKLSFSSEITSGAQNEQLTMLISNDFDGNYMDFDSMIHSDWTDITRWFSLPRGKGRKESSAQDISAFVYSDRPLYLAFRYRCRPQEQYGEASRWVISNLRFTNTSEELGETVLYDLVNSGFRITDPFSRTDAVCMSSVSQTQIVMQGRVQSEDVPAAAYETEHWIVSRPIDLTSIRDIGPDRPKVIKGYAESFPTTYSYIYESPGVYEAVFVASNQSIRDCKEAVSSITITVSE